MLRQPSQPRTRSPDRSMISGLIATRGSIAGASLLNAGLKSILHRPRPELVPHLAVVSNASFPSGHAMISAAIYLTIAAMLSETQPKRSARIFLMAFAGLLVLLIGCSRIYLGVHWPSDVLAGWCLGSVWALVVFAVNRTLRTRGAARAIRHCRAQPSAS